MICSYLFLWYTLSEERGVCIGEAVFHEIDNQGERDENWLHHYKVNFLLTGCTIKQVATHHF